MAGRPAGWLGRRAPDLPYALAPSGGWRGVEDFPEPLQFAAYVAQHEGFAFDEEAAPGSEAEREWRHWWLALPEQCASLDRQVRAFFQHGGPVPRPHDFAPPADLPHLEPLCDRYRAPFRQEWTGIKLAVMRIQLDPNAHRIDFNRVIRVRERELGRRTRPFAYRIDFVFWPNDYMRAVSESHLVLSIDYLDEAHRAAYERLMRGMIRQLV